MEIIIFILNLFYFSWNHSTFFSSLIFWKYFAHLEACSFKALVIFKTNDKFLRNVILNRKKWKEHKYFREFRYFFFVPWPRMRNTNNSKIMFLRLIHKYKISAAFEITWVNKISNSRAVNSKLMFVDDSYNLRLKNCWYHILRPCKL
jgi:hypothetical protein